MRVRSKFRLANIHQFAGSETRTFKFEAVCDDGTPENERFSKYTPSGDITIAVNNPNVDYQIGKCYYFDSTPCPE